MNNNYIKKKMFIATLLNKIQIVDHKIKIIKIFNNIIINKPKEKALN